MREQPDQLRHRIRVHLLHCFQLCHTFTPPSPRTTAMVPLPMPAMALTSLRLPGPTFWPKAERFVTTLRKVMALNLASEGTGRR